MNDLLRANRLPRIATVPALLWLTVFLVLPVTVMVARYVGVDDVSRVLRRDTTWRVVWFSTWQAVLSVAATFLLGTPVAWLIGRHDFRGRRALRAISTLGFLLPSMVVAAGFLAVLPDSLHYSVFAIVVAHAYFNLAVVVRVVGARLELVDQRLVDAAGTLGATPLRALRTITWPLVRPAVASAGIVVFLYCFTSFAVVRVLGGPARNTVESDIALRAFGIGDVGGATVLGILQLAVILVVLAIARTTGGRNVVPSDSRTTALPGLDRRHLPVVVVVGAATVLFVVAPLVSVAWRSVRIGGTTSLAAWRSVFDAGLRDSLFVSVRTALIAGLLGVVLATTVGMAVVRLGRAGRTIDVLAFVPLAVSPVTLGLGLVVTFDAGWYDWRAAWWFVAVAHTLVALPLAVRVLVPAWHAVPTGLHEAAAVLGAGEFRRFLDVDLRFVRRAMVAGFGLVIAVSLGEFGAASLLSRSGAETVPVVVGRLLTRTGDLVRAQAFALSTVLVVLCIGALLVVESLLGRNARARGG